MIEKVKVAFEWVKETSQYLSDTWTNGKAPWWVWPVAAVVIAVWVL